MKKKVKKKLDDYSKNISFEDNLILPVIYGRNDENLKMLENNFNISILPRGNFLRIQGNQNNVELAIAILEKIYEQAVKNRSLSLSEINAIINIFKNQDMEQSKSEYEVIDSSSIVAGRKIIKPRSKKQFEYFNLLRNKQMVFCCGPAGTGKTYLSVAYAVSMLKSGQIEKIILTRPAVEAGEHLGFLPGDIKEKIDPYLRPIYDALNDMLSFSEVIKKLESGFIEIAPLAFMRGRTLSNAFIILDESQNTTPIQMKMFLTRLGENSKMIINGDLSQVDLPSGTKSGLRESINILQKVNDIGFIEFTEKDVVRNPLVSKIVTEYEKFERDQGVGKKYLIKRKKNSDD